MKDLKNILKDISKTYNINYDVLLSKYVYTKLKGLRNYDDIIFTDGGCINNGKVNAKAGYGVYFPRDESRNLSINLGKSTNQEAELTAIYTAMNSSIGKDILIITDSQYSINCITKWIKNWRRNGWQNSKKQRIKNYEIIRKIDYFLNENTNKKFSFHHINSHEKEPTEKDTIEYFLWNGNDNADRLATSAIHNN